MSHAGSQNCSADFWMLECFTLIGIFLLQNFFCQAEKLNACAVNRVEIDDTQLNITLSGFDRCEYKFIKGFDYKVEIETGSKFTVTLVDLDNGANEIARFDDDKAILLQLKNLQKTMSLRLSGGRGSSVLLSQEEHLIVDGVEFVNEYVRLGKSFCKWHFGENELMTSLHVDNRGCWLSEESNHDLKMTSCLCAGDFEDLKDWGNIHGTDVIAMQCTLLEIPHGMVHMFRYTAIVVDDQIVSLTVGDQTRELLKHKNQLFFPRLPTVNPFSANYGGRVVADIFVLNVHRIGNFKEGDDFAIPVCQRATPMDTSTFDMPKMKVLRT